MSPSALGYADGLAKLDLSASEQASKQAAHEPFQAAGVATAGNRSRCRGCSTESDRVRHGNQRGGKVRSRWCARIPAGGASAGADSSPRPPRACQCLARTPE
ncbi:hypothetical protein BFJ66_g17663 [Fusarium oxysporum f. sp. cepae]|nr:hypothetical protein BFJ66_g17663 [Fusarium oxysporum f. sp. cepae]